MASIRVLVVEDSITQRHQLVSLIQNAPGMAVVGQARDGLEAVQFVEELRPDVISMDIRMPRLGGLEATRQIMESFPTPIVIVSHASSDAQVAMQAMQAGALAAVEKPPMKGHPDYAARCDELVSMLRLMSGVRVIRHWSDPSTRAVKGDTKELNAEHLLKAAAVSQPLLKRQTGPVAGTTAGDCGDWGERWRAGDTGADFGRAACRFSFADLDRPAPDEGVHAGVSRMAGSCRAAFCPAGGSGRDAPSRYGAGRARQCSFESQRR